MAQPKLQTQKAKAERERRCHKKLLELEVSYWADGKQVAGLDEAGAGPLAGPVTAGCVVLDPDRVQDLVGVNDSKQLSQKRRAEFKDRIQASVSAWAVAHATVEEIDRINIREAGILAMQRALDKVLKTFPAVQHLLIDARTMPYTKITQSSIIRGDSTSLSIAAASVLAKVERDIYMCHMAEKFPDYGFERHMGYGTKTHLAALNKYGATPLHRRSFAPVHRRIHQMNLPI